jgi:hypothetical protein
MIRRYWIVKCDYCGVKYFFDGSTKPTDAQLKERGLIVRGLQRHYCDERCAYAADRMRTLNEKTI